MDNKVYVQGMIVNAMITALGMQAENMQRASQGESMAYREEDFQELIEKNGVHHNALIEELNQQY